MQLKQIEARSKTVEENHTYSHRRVSISGSPFSSFRDWRIAVSLFMLYSRDDYCCVELVGLNVGFLTLKPNPSQA